jgi:hypothetical protein
MADDGNLVSDIVVLSIELAGDVIANMDTYAARILQLPDVKSKLQTLLDQLAQKQFEAASGARPGQAQGQLAAQFAQDVGKALSGPALDEIKKLPEAQQLLAKVKRLGKALDEAGSVGIWHDKKLNLLYLVLGGVALGGAVSLYVLKAGNVVSNGLLSMLSNKSVKFLQLGKVTLNGELLKFETGDGVKGGRDLELKTFATADWKPVTVTVSMVGKAVGDHLTVGGGVDGKVVVPLGGGATLTPSVHADADSDGNRNLSLMVGFTKDKLSIDVLAAAKRTIPQLPSQPGGGTDSFTVSGSAKYDTKLFGAPASVGVTASDTTGPKGNEVKVMGGITVHF